MNAVAITHDTSNTMFNLAVELVNKTSRNIFLTGKAGTGKTTFLKYIRDNCHKQLAIVAPTGVAAINAGGVTIHSFFQLPFSPFIPESAGFNTGQPITDTHALLGQLRLTGEKKKVIQELELLIIDEISMVRCDVLDAIDTVMRHIRHRRTERFGGAQVLLIGDMFQLPPVVPDQEWGILSDYYDSPYFFDSRVIAQEPPVYIEFNKIYRQSEERFINLLNKVRNNEMDKEGFDLLDSRFDAGFRRSKNDGYIILTTHNRKADAINELELGKVDAPIHSFDAQIDGEFSEKAYPTDERLLLKAGAQVMFIKNDVEKQRRYFNGKLGVVTRIDRDKLFVRCGDEDEIEVKQETWKNIRYVVDKTTRKMEEEVLGSFTQFPLRLAWAITIHKSQGLTFEKAIIDAGEAFAPGQVYVALSRCTSLSGMVLHTRIRQASLSGDIRIVAFSKTAIDPGMIQDELAKSQKEYERVLLSSQFEFGVIKDNCQSLRSYTTAHKQSFSTGTVESLQQLQDIISEIQDVGARFQSQLKAIYTQIVFDKQLAMDRTRSAAVFFDGKLNECLELLQALNFKTDSKLHAKEINTGLKELFALLSFRRYILQACLNGFSVDIYQERKKRFILPAFAINVYAGSGTDRMETPHPALYVQLRTLRDSICMRADLPIYLVAGSNTLFELSRYLPQSVAELKKITGFGEAKVQKYGQGFLDLIQAYCTANGLQSRMHEKSAKEGKKEASTGRRSKVDTKEETYKLFLKGLSTESIASERNLAISTIEGHLASCVRQGLIPIEKLVSMEKLELIEPFVNEHYGSSLNVIKGKCGPDISFGEIRMVIAWKEFHTPADQLQ